MKKVEKCLFSSKNVPLTALPLSYIYIYGTPPEIHTLWCFQHFSNPMQWSNVHLLASMQPNICLPQCYQVFAWLNATTTVSGHRISCSLLRQIQTWDFRLEILKSEQLIHGSKIQDCRKFLSRNLGSMDPRSQIQDFRKLLSRNLGSMDPKSKI